MSLRVRCGSVLVLAVNFGSDQQVLPCQSVSGLKRSVCLLGNYSSRSAASALLLFDKPAVRKPQAVWWCLTSAVSFRHWRLLTGFNEVFYVGEQNVWTCSVCGEHTPYFTHLTENTLRRWDEGTGCVKCWKLISGFQDDRLHHSVEQPTNQSSTVHAKSFPLPRYIDAAYQQWFMCSYRRKNMIINKFWMSVKGVNRDQVLWGCRSQNIFSF